MNQLFYRIVVLLTSLFVCCYLYAAPEKDLWVYWQHQDPHSKKIIQHTAWTQLLRKYDHHSKSGVNLFSYNRVSAPDKEKLQDYINYLQSIHIRHYNIEQQEAYWINLYNAETVNLILRHYPIKSILSINISPGLFSKGPWDAKLLKISGKAVTLNDIEHRILRPIFHDNRLHYALNCASLGCPNLQRHAFTASRLNSMLDKGAKLYINSYRGAHFSNGKLIVSKIYIWYQIDFGGSDVGVIAHLKKYAEPKLRSQLNQVSHISGSEYNWNLNLYDAQLKHSANE